MLTYIESSIFTSPAEVLVNTVNTEGVMGKGIALNFKKMFPEMFTEYREKCEAGEFGIGNLLLYRSRGKSVLNFPTKTNWRRPSKREYIESGLRTFVQTYENLNIDSIAFPQLGCGNGNLDWEETVKPLMEEYLANLPIRVFVHLRDFESEPEHLSADRMRQWLRNRPGEFSALEAWSDLIQLVDAGRSHWYVDSRDSLGPFDEEEQIEVIVYEESDSSPTVVARDDFVSFWHALRQNGVVAMFDSPPMPETTRSEFIELVSELPYVRQVRVKNRVDSTFRLGLQREVQTVGTQLSFMV